MAVTIKTPTQTSPGNWRIDYTSSLDDPTFYIYQDGLQIATTKETSLQIVVKAGDSPVFDILDDADALPSESFPGRLTISWFNTEATDHYRIEEFVSAVWTLRQKVAEDGRGYYQWKTRFLEDETTHQFRIIPVGTNGNQGTSEDFSVLMVRHPDVPSVTYSYDGGTDKLTITGA